MAADLFTHVLASEVYETPGLPVEPDNILTDKGSGPLLGRL